LPASRTLSSAPSPTAGRPAQTDCCCRASEIVRIGTLSRRSFGHLCKRPFAGTLWICKMHPLTGRGKRRSR
jgi:hypothetical protein